MDVVRVNKLGVSKIQKNFWQKYDLTIVVTVSIVMTFIFKLAKFRAFTLMNICPYKGKLKEGPKNGQNGTLCLAPNSELIFDLPGPKFGQ